jgi:hypothetical protein
MKLTDSYGDSLVKSKEQPNVEVISFFVGYIESGNPQMPGLAVGSKRAET